MGTGSGMGEGVYRGIGLCFLHVVQMLECCGQAPKYKLLGFIELKGAFTFVDTIKTRSSAPEQELA